MCFLVNNLPFYANSMSRRKYYLVSVKKKMIPQLISYLAHIFMRVILINPVSLTCHYQSVATIAFFWLIIKQLNALLQCGRQTFTLTFYCKQLSILLLICSSFHFINFRFFLNSNKRKITNKLLCFLSTTLWPCTSPILINWL